MKFLKHIITPLFFIFLLALAWTNKAEGFDIFLWISTLVLGSLIGFKLYQLKSVVKG